MVLGGTEGPQDVRLRYTTKCLPLNGMSGVRLEVGQSVVLGFFTCPPWVEIHVHDHIGVVVSQ